MSGRREGINPPPDPRLEKHHDPRDRRHHRRNHPHLGYR
nr:MAG TPA: hypothetical protein [Caudoviricetes sp.]